MINKNALPDNFSGIDEFKKTTADFQKGTDAVVIYIYHYSNGELHRDDGPALISSDGRKEWWQFGAKHRDGEPAVIYPDGKMQWYQQGLMHRDDGPASEHPSGHKEWWLNGNELSQEEFSQWRMKKDLNEKLHTTLPSRSIARRGKI